MALINKNRLHFDAILKRLLLMTWLVDELLGYLKSAVHTIQYGIGKADRNATTNTAELKTWTHVRVDDFVKQNRHAINMAVFIIR